MRTQWEMIKFISNDNSECDAVLCMIGVQTKEYCLLLRAYKYQMPKYLISDNFPCHVSQKCFIVRFFSELTEISNELFISVSKLFSK